MAPKSHKVLFALFVIMLFGAIGCAPVWAGKPTRHLSAVQIQVMNLRQKAQKSQTVINFWHHGGRWIIQPRHKQCTRMFGKKGQKICRIGRRDLAMHSRRLASVQLWLENLMPWARDVRKTYKYRQCLIDYESRHQGIYAAENGGTPGVESSINSDASGAYQFLDSTWSRELPMAEKYYGIEISSASHAAYASPRAQDIMATFAIIVLNGNDWTHSRCRAIVVPQ